MRGRPNPQGLTKSRPRWFATSATVVDHGPATGCGGGNLSPYGQSRSGRGALGFRIRSWRVDQRGRQAALVASSVGVRHRGQPDLSLEAVAGQQEPEVGRALPQQAESARED